MFVLAGILRTFFCKQANEMVASAHMTRSCHLTDQNEGFGGMQNLCQTTNMRACSSCERAGSRTENFANPPEHLFVEFHAQKFIV
jgi:hypothetical protein